jgi:phosphoglycerate dehydrogenase-like enzyme
MSPKPKAYVLILIPLKKQTLAMLRDEFPKVEFHQQVIKSVQELPRQLLEKTEILIMDTMVIRSEDVPNLKWLHIFKTVVDVRVFGMDFFKKPDLVVTNNSGVTAPAYADIALMQMFSLGYQLSQIYKAKETHSFNLDAGKYPVSRLYDSTIGIIGYGSVGREIARITHGLGVKILAVKRDMMHPEDPDYTLPGHGDPGGDYFHRLYPPQAIGSMVKECDFVLVTVPHTAETHQLVNGDVFAQMKAGSYLINMSLSEVIDLDALQDALNENRIAGAALVQFPGHEFSQSSTLWTQEKVMIFPPFSALIRNEEEKAVLLLIDNLRQYLNGGLLTNRIDVERGY